MILSISPSLEIKKIELKDPRAFLSFHNQKATEKKYRIRPSDLKSNAVLYIFHFLSMLSFKFLKMYLYMSAGHGVYSHLGE